MQKNLGAEDKEFQKLQDALLQRIMSSKLPQEREQLLSMHQRLVRQQRLKQARVTEELGQQRGLV